MNSREPIVLFWFRRDLRIGDNTGLYHALRSGYRVIPLFIFDREILSRLDSPYDRRIEFILGALRQLQVTITAAQSSFLVFHDTVEKAFNHLLAEFSVKAVYANHDYEPYAVSRDEMISKILKRSGIPFYTFKDQVIFEKDDVLKPDGKPYTVFTPYSRSWKRKLGTVTIDGLPSHSLTGNFFHISPQPLPTLQELGFHDTGYSYSSPIIDENIIRHYHLTRDIPSLHGTSRLSVHLRFGTVSIRHLVSKGLELNEVWLNELIWREFFMSILWHFPKVVNNSFRSRYDNISWRNNEKEFDRWCRGMTGYPIVDAGMRELNATGLMHNRVRMITASFLTRHLLTDWRWGEAYFAGRLLDHELSSNNGNWQWAAGSGCDAAPYFRIFNPDEQTRKYDPDMTYIKMWVPEVDTPQYPGRIIDHALARKRALETYSEGIGI
jgi:deoxyribodipyrimidine photo-lyase